MCNSLHISAVKLDLNSFPWSLVRVQWGIEKRQTAHQPAFLQLCSFLVKDGVCLHPSGIVVACNSDVDVPSITLREGGKAQDIYGNNLHGVISELLQWLG